LVAEQEDPIAKRLAAFFSRYQTPENLKIKSAAEKFTRKQAIVTSLLT